ncbi:hypothetical protein B1202_06985 [Acinetobacter amyesii]|uniref:Uncharacterized protein n=1 Tax=Acinetobacter amyesii TaxID=2942470 RepID=A0A1T1H0T7_9GAMM|nr:hypothetical protein B1202_06985 [Acinetobacter amyesii]
MAILDLDVEFEIVIQSIVVAVVLNLVVMKNLNEKFRILSMKKMDIKKPCRNRAFFLLLLVTSR